MTFLLHVDRRSSVTRMISCQMKVVRKQKKKVQNQGKFEAAFQHELHSGQDYVNSKATKSVSDPQPTWLFHISNFFDFFIIQKTDEMIIGKVKSFRRVNYQWLIYNHFVNYIGVLQKNHGADVYIFNYIFISKLIVERCVIVKLLSMCLDSAFTWPPFSCRS